jgi:serine/threonine-protein kinase
VGLTQKILLFTSAIIVALAAITLAYTTVEANRLAEGTIQQMLSETEQVWETFQKDRYSKLRLGMSVLANDPYFKALLERGEELTVADTLQERGADMGSDFFIATDPDGIVMARSDQADAAGQDLSAVPVVIEALEGDGAGTIWAQDGRLYHTVSAPILLGQDFLGVLLAGYAIDDRLADDIRKITHSEIAYLTHEPGFAPRVLVSSLGSGKQEALTGLLGGPAFATSDRNPFEVGMPGDPSVGVLLPLESTDGSRVGSMLALRSRAVETQAFRRFRNSLIVVSLVVMVLALAAGSIVARRITGPVRLLVDLVQRARDGSYQGAVAVATTDEIGTLARAFNRLLADLREKEQMIGFLRDGLTVIKQGAAGSTTALGTTDSGETADLSTARTQTIDALRLQRGQIFANRYEIKSTLGKGGMGIVYRAHDRRLDEDVALKLLRPEVVKQDSALLERFKQELKLARRITHRNVLRTYDFDETDGVPYISMEYVEGVMLKDLLRSKGPLPVGVGLRIAKQICQGLEAAHEQGVVHRDVKPQNMLILPDTGEVRIMDFGIARKADLEADGGITTEGTVMGTPDYMPPEQAQGKPADLRSDIYSLGVVLFEMFTGRLPFRGETPVATVVQHIREPPPKPRSIQASIPVEIETIIMRCMMKRPNSRYADVATLYEALSAASAKSEAPAA